MKTDIRKIKNILLIKKFQLKERTQKSLRSPQEEKVAKLLMYKGKPNRKNETMKK